MTTEHLGTPEEVEQFSLEMLKQLDLHRKEKTGLRNWDFDQVFKLVMDQIDDRLLEIKLHKDKELTEKQCVHIANYLLMLRLKCIDNE